MKEEIEKRGKRVILPLWYFQNCKIESKASCLSKKVIVRFSNFPILEISKISPCTLNEQRTRNTRFVSH